MDGNTVGAGSLGSYGESDRIRLDSTTRGACLIAITSLTHCCAMIDVYAEENHGTASNDRKQDPSKSGKWICLESEFAGLLRLSMPSASTPPKRESTLLNLTFNILIPSLVLMKFSTDKWLGPLWGIVVAVVFPLGYGIYDLIERKKANLFSIVGIISVLLLGGLGIMKAGGIWFAIKEAAIPTVFGVAVLLTLRSKNSIVRQLLLNEQVIDVEKVTAAVDARGQRVAFEKLMRDSSIWVAASFFGSAILNFALARYVLRSPPNTTQFNEELGRMNMYSWPVIVVPSMAVMMFVIWKLLNGLSALTGLTSDEIFHAEKKKAEK